MEGRDCVYLACHIRSQRQMGKHSHDSQEQRALEIPEETPHRKCCLSWEPESHLPPTATHPVLGTAVPSLLQLPCCLILHA